MSPELRSVSHASRASAAIAVVGLAVVVGSTAYGARAVGAARSEISRLEASRTALEADNRKLEQRKQELVSEIAISERKVLALGELANTALAAVSPRAGRSTVEAVIADHPAAAAVVRRVYIHIRSEPQRARAVEMARALREQGYIVPGIERLVYAGPSSTQVRYFAPAARGEAERIAKVLEAAGLDEAHAWYTRGYEDVGAGIERQFEIWLAPPP